MPRVRLTGLFLFITAIILSLASAATHTTHLRIKRFDALSPAPAGVPLPGSAPGSSDPGSVSPLPNPTQNALADAELSRLQFISVPMIYPLAGIALSGLALWFIPAALVPQPGDGRSRRAKKRRRKSP